MTGHTRWSAVREIRRLRAALDDVDALHRQDTGTGRFTPRCLECEQEWPCSTRRALDRHSDSAPPALPQTAEQAESVHGATSEGSNAPESETHMPRCFECDAPVPHIIRIGGLLCDGCITGRTHLP